MSKIISGKSCLHCNGPIQSRGPRRDAKAKLCSAQCRVDYAKALSAAAGAGLLAKNCATCGKEFSYYRSTRPSATYCSMTCRHRSEQPSKLAGRVQDYYRLPSTFRKSMRRFFYDRCAICGWDEAKCDVAHIEPRQNGGEDELENVVMLCPNHHRVYDLGLIPVEQVRMAREHILRPERIAQWQEWMRQRGRLANATRWHPDDTDEIAAARRDLASAREAIL